MNQKRPVVLAIAGLDPSGGAGIQADIQTLSSLDCHCTPIISTLTVQNSCSLYQVHPVSSEIIEQQITVLSNEFNFSSIKLGALGSAENAAFIGRWIQKLKKTHQGVAIILDPVIKASSGGALGDNELRNALLNEVIPYCTLITPNEPELEILSSDGNGPAAIEQFTNLGVSVLVTGGHTKNTVKGTLENQLITGSGKQQYWEINAIEGEFRGTGCTLSAAIAGFMAKGLEVNTAIEKAQDFVSRSLKHAYKLRSGQQIPQRNDFSI
jgi:hydroxymethylpyrimidine/phosphomethylpyrimidine kinase